MCVFCRYQDETADMDEDEWLASLGLAGSAAKLPSPFGSPSNSPKLRAAPDTSKPPLAIGIVDVSSLPSLNLDVAPAVGAGELDAFGFPKDDPMSLALEAALRSATTAPVVNTAGNPADPELHAAPASKTTNTQAEVDPLMSLALSRPLMRRGRNLTSLPPLASTSFPQTLTRTTVSRTHQAAKKMTTAPAQSMADEAEALVPC